ncbi:MAG: hypothetical protein IJX40_02215 [Alistipes sp.]|nr:hypothetical protein [Alistipes sp.]
MTRQHDDIADIGAQERIRREVIILESEEHDPATERDDEDNDGVEHDSDTRREKPWMMFTTGSILTDGTLPYYRYFIAIAAMCFVSIFLTFMSLNADREYRLREKYASVLHERAVLKEEERYGLSSKNAVQRRLEEHGIELIDLSKESRLIERR